MSTFYVHRKDLGEGDVRVETTGLTLGRQPHNDVVLRHPYVSRTHAGIASIDGEMWLCNLSASNGTLLNGELADKVVLSSSDVVDIGPYRLLIEERDGGLSVAVEVNQAATPLNLERPGATAVDQNIETILGTGADGQRARFVGPSGLTSIMAPADEDALQVFWQKRLREQGKVRAVNPLSPVGQTVQLGKARNNWRPTRDLRRRWPFSALILAGTLLVVGSAVAAFIAPRFFSPGPLATVHSSAPVAGHELLLAKASNEGACSECHVSGAAIEQGCIDCHQTDSFEATVFEAHEREGIGCASCHSEHHGESSTAGLLSEGVCSDCHNQEHRIGTGERAGQLLEVPHGGSTGYPASLGVWLWEGLDSESWLERGLPADLTELPAKEQFHLVHQLGPMKDRMECSDCHTSGVTTVDQLREGPKEQCAVCHGVRFEAGEATAIAANCTTCHQQHGHSRQLQNLIAASDQSSEDLDSASRDDESIKQYLAALAPRRNAGGSPPDTPPTSEPDPTRILPGALSLPAWLALLGGLPLLGLIAFGADARRRRRSLLRALQAPDESEPGAEKIEEEPVRTKKGESRPYPHPIVDPLKCIGCYACVEACPHDVLRMIGGISVPVEPDQCMEDLGCVIACPTNPKAIEVRNTSKKVRAPKVPGRDQRFMTSVQNVYLIGDVSGVPLIKNAINEGGGVIEYIARDLESKKANLPADQADFDVAIIGLGPAGLAATAQAAKHGLSYLAIEQSRLLSTIQSFPAGKYVFFKPDGETTGPLPLSGAGGAKESTLEQWIDLKDTMKLRVHEGVRCTGIGPDADLLQVETINESTKEPSTHTVRSVVLAIGNRGAPLQLRVDGEDLVIKSTDKSGELARLQKVQYDLRDPDDFVGKKIIVVGAGNSAIEAAADLCGLDRTRDDTVFLRDNHVTLVIRSDFKGDVKLGNKMAVYKCADAGRLKMHFGTVIQQIRPTEVVLAHVRTGEEIATIDNDFVLALIGAQRPTSFLEKIGIKIG